MPNLLVTDRDRACLKAIEAVFPEVPRRICKQHLLKDVLVYTCLTFEQEPEEESREYVDNEKTVKWYNLFQKAVYTPEEAEFRTICLELKAMWPKGFVYLEKEWLLFTLLQATFRLKRIRIQGVRATSRIEGVYTTIKSWLGTLQSNTYGLVERLLLYFRIQVSKYQQELSEETSYTLIQMPRTFQSFYRKVYRYAIQEVLAQYTLATDKTRPVLPYIGVFSFTTELPCLYYIRACIAENKTVSLTTVGERQKCDRRVLVENEDIREIELLPSR